METQIPDDCLVQVFCYLSVPDLVRTAIGCSRFRRLIKTSCLYPVVVPDKSEELLGVLDLIGKVRSISLCSTMGTGTCQTWVRPGHLRAIANTYQSSLQRLDLGLWCEMKHSPNRYRFKVLTDELKDISELRCPLECLVQNTKAISTFKNLSKLSIGSSGCSTQLLRSLVGYLAHLPHLRSFYVQAHFDAELAALLSKCRSLKQLSFGGEGMSDDAARHIQHLIQLEYLDASGNDGSQHIPLCLTDIGLGYLKELRNMRELNLYGNYGISDEGIRSVLKEMKYLENLCIGSPKVEDSTVKALVDYGIAAKIKILGLQGSSITSSAIPSLLNFPLLRKLDLSYCYRVKDDALTSLKSLIDRKIRINMEETGLSYDGWNIAEAILGHEQVQDTPQAWISIGGNLEERRCPDAKASSSPWMLWTL